MQLTMPHALPKRLGFSKRFRIGRCNRFRLDDGLTCLKRRGSPQR